VPAPSLAVAELAVRVVEWSSGRSCSRVLHTRRTLTEIVAVTREVAERQHAPPARRARRARQASRPVAPMSR
jgi:hypothetical protein